MELTSGRSPKGNMWYLRTACLADGRWEVRNVMTDHHPDGTVVHVDDLAPEVAARLGDDTVVWRAGVDDLGRCRVAVSDWAAPGAPAGWFVLVRGGIDPGIEPEMCGVAAFATGHLPDGTVVTPSEAADLGVSAADQSAAVRWVRDSGAVRNIHTDPARRRQHLGIKLLHTAGGIVRHHGWPGKLHSDGLRTDEGERFVMALNFRARTAPWTTVARIEQPDGRSSD